MGKNLANTNFTFLFCDGGSCQKAGSEKAAREARAYLRNNGHWDNTHTIKTRCNGRCEDAPTCIVQSGNYWYKKITPKTVVDIVKSHLEKDEPLKAELLYREGWDKMRSDNERSPVKPKGFTIVQDDLLGECWWTKGFSSDQYLYPLFLFIQEHEPIGKITLADGLELDLKTLKSVTYEDPYSIQLLFENDREIKLVIGSIPKTAPIEITKQKITATAYLLSTTSGEVSIRFMDKKGNFIASIRFGANQEKVREYLSEVQLRGVVIPQIIMSDKC